MNYTERHKIVFLLWVGIVVSTACFATAIAAERFQEPVDVSFTADCDGTIQKYVLLLPEAFADDQPHSLMIALHGHGSDRWQFATGDIAQGQAVRDVALKYDMIYVCPDYRATTSWMGPKAEADMVQIIKALKQTYKIKNIIITGGSMGGSSSLSFTAMHPELIQGVVAMNGTANHLEYKNYQDAIHESFGGTQQEIPEEYKRRSAEYWPERFTMPVAITTGGKDTAVPPESTTRLASILKIFNPNVLHIHRPETGHTTSYEDAATTCEYVCEKVLKQ